MNTVIKQTELKALSQGSFLFFAPLLTPSEQGRRASLEGQIHRPRVKNLTKKYGALACRPETGGRGPSSYYRSR